MERLSPLKYTAWADLQIRTNFRECLPLVRFTGGIALGNRPCFSNFAQKTLKPATLSATRAFLVAENSENVCLLGVNRGAWHLSQSVASPDDGAEADWTRILKAFTSPLATRASCCPRRGSRARGKSYLVLAGPRNSENVCPRLEEPPCAARASRGP